jgi:hypothetical protein
MRTLAVITIVALCIAVAALTRAVVRLENYRSANAVGFCAEFNIADPQQRIEREKCLDAKQTRTHWVWHIVYALSE